MTYVEILNTHTVLNSTAKDFHYTKNRKKFCNAKTFLLKKSNFFVFSKFFVFFQKLALQNFFIFCLLLVHVASEIVHEKNGGRCASFPTTQTNRLF